MFWKLLLIGPPKFIFALIPEIYYRSAYKSLARPTSRCILFDGENISFDGENISFDASFVIYVYK